MTRQGNADTLKRRLSDRILISLYALFVFVAISSDLKQLIPYLHWILLVLFSALAVPFAFRRRLFSVSPVLVGPLLFVVGSGLGAVASNDPIYSFAETLKVFVILVLGLSMLSNKPRLVEVAYKAFIVSVYANALLLIVGSHISPVLAGATFLGRLGTVLDHGGQLWRAGIVVLVLACLNATYSRRHFAWALTAVAALYLIVADGTRTGLIIVAFAVIYMAAVIAYERGAQLIRIATAMLVGAVVVTIATFGVISLLSARIDLKANGSARIIELIQGIAKNGAAGIVAADPARASMLKTVVHAIAIHPILGTGFESTLAPTPVGPMVIHMTYLQAWADHGVLGFLGLCITLLFWMPFTVRILSTAKAARTTQEKALIYNSLFLMIYFAVTSLFHPLSTEWPEWIAFLVPAGHLATILFRRAPVRVEA